jgi:predicted DNA-binding transcriptional regulator YafY
MLPVQNQTPLAIEFAPGQVIRFRYKNWQGVVAERTARVVSLVYGSTEWHPEPQWLLRAFDFERQDVRLFALRDMLPLKDAATADSVKPQHTIKDRASASRKDGLDQAGVPTTP